MTSTQASTNKTNLKNIFTTAKHDSWVLPYLKQYHKALAASLFLGGIALIFAAGLMFASGYLISDAAERPELGLFSLLVPLGLVQVFGIGKPFLSYAERLASHDWVLRITANLQAKLFHVAGSRGILWVSTRKAGELLGLLNDDIAHVQDLYLRSVFPLALGLIAWLAATVAFGIASPAAALALYLALLILIAVLPFFAMLLNAARTVYAKHCAASEMAALSDATEGLTDWVISGRRSSFIAQLTESGNKRTQTQARIEKSLRRFELVQHLVFTAISVCVLIWAVTHFQTGLLAGDGSLRAEEFIAAFVLGLFPLLDAFAPLPQAAASATRHAEAISHLNALGEAPTDIRNEESSEGAPQNEGSGSNTVASAQTQESLARPASTATPAAASVPTPTAALTPTAAPAPTPAPTTTPTPAPKEGSYTLSFDNASVRYPGEATMVLKNLTLSIPAGQKLAVLGPSGCGKTTLLAALRGDLLPAEGSVKLGAVPTSKLGPQASMYFSLIEQKPRLFNRSLYENITLGDTSISRETACQALKDAGLAKLLERLPQGIDTIVQESGSNFSGGECHRIALARALARPSKIVMFDEPTVSLDPTTEIKLIETILRTLSNRTVIVVTHHLAGVQLFDRVLLMDQGQVELDGSPQELQKQSDYYRALCAFDSGL